MIQNLRRRSFRIRLILTFSLITVSLVIILSRVGYLTAREIYLAQLKEQTLNLCNLISADLNVNQLNLLEPGIKSGIQKMYQQKLNKKAQRSGLPKLFIINSDFRIMASGGNTAENLPDLSAILLNRQKLLSMRPGEINLSQPFLGMDAQWYFWGFYRLNDSYWLVLQENAKRFTRVEQISQYFWLIGFAGILLTVLAAWYLTRSLARPIDRLVSFSTALGSGQFETPLPHEIQGELSILAAAMDTMRNNLKSNHREKEQMLAQIAHEIRNPLGGMELLAGLIKEDLNKKGHDDLYIQIIQKEITQLNGLITAYLNYSRPLKANRQYVELSPLLAEVEHLFNARLKKERINLLIKTDNGVLFFDRDHLKQVCVNLISNSIEAQNSDDGIIEIQYSIKENKKYLTVRDNGPGIPPESFTKIFEPFFTEKASGTGLGLAISRKICIENKARLSARNLPGGGCEFSICQNGKN